MSINSPFGKVEITGELSDISKYLTKNITEEIEAQLKRDLFAQVDPIISKIATDLAKQLVVNLKAYTHRQDPLGNTQVTVVLNIDKHNVDIQD